MKRKYIARAMLVTIIILLIVSAFFAYRKLVSPTVIGFINYPDYIFARFDNANQNSFIKVERINWKKGEETNLSRFNAVYVFGMGLKLSPERLANIKKAINNGLPVYVQAATSKKNNINSLTGKQLEYIQNCLSYGGKINFRLLLNYTRRVIDGKKLFADIVTPPVKVPFDGLFHIGEGKIFETLESYEQYRRENKLIHPNGPKVCFMTSTAGPEAEHIQAIVSALEAENINIYPIFGFRKRLDFIRKISPDMVILMPHGRFTTQKENEVIDYLKTRNIPLLCPINIHRPNSEWEKDQRGMTGGIMSQSIIMPELDGGIIPFVLAAQFKNERGLYVFKPLPKRIKKFCSMAKKFLTLRNKANKDKKIVIVYFKGPGKNALVAAGLEVVPSLYHTLKLLQKSGYDTGTLPENPAALEKMIQARASLFNPYAKGSIDKFIRESKPQLIPVPDYLNWVSKAMPADLYAEVEKRYGDAPGPYMSTTDAKGVPQIALGTLQFGNVVLTPQSLPGYGDNANKLIHGAKQAPPHPYIATYLWARFGFKADAIIHFGTHGSLEFTPWKQVALSDYDWPDVLIGDMPHFYIYTINNIGEAVIAKRRSYATMVSHLTPPFMTSELYDELGAIHDKIHEWLSAEENQRLRDEYGKSIIQLVRKKKIDRELKLGDLKTLDKDIISRLHNYIHEIEDAKVNRGLYVLGRSYSESQAAETARLMAVDSIATGLADIDLVTGKITSKQKSNSHFFDKNYRETANKLIDQVFKGVKPESLIAPSDLANYKKSMKNRTQNGSVNIMAMMIGMQANAAEDSRNRGSGHQKAITANDKQTIKNLLLKNCEQDGGYDFILKLQEPKTFDRVSSLANPRNIARAKRMAQLIKPMKEMIDIATRPDMLRLIRMIQQKPMREYLFELLKDKDVKEKILAEKSRRVQQKIATTLSKPYVNTLYMALSPELDKQLNSNKITDMNKLAEKIKTTMELKERLEFVLSVESLADQIALKKNIHATNVAKILKTSTKSINSAIAKCEKAIKKASAWYNDYLHAVKCMVEAVNSVTEYRTALLESTNAEADALLNALQGGYILPSPGADPIRNPNSIPTGRNMFAIDTESTPTKEAWKVAVQLGDQLIKSKLSASGKYPQKVAFTLWGGEFIRSRGVNVAEILYMLGVEPVWNSRGRVRDVKLIPMEKLNRPRIDVIVQTSGQFRGAATSRLYLIDKAVRLAAQADDNGKFANHVKEGTLAAEKVMIAKGYSPLEARKLSTARIFGGVNGKFGTGITGLVESGDKWEKDQEISDRYLKNMGAIYTRDNWCEFKEGVFEAALQNTDTVVQPRSSNTWGPLSLDHVYEFMGGINLTVKNVTGNNPDIYFNDLRSSSKARVQSAKEAAMVEARTTVLNPKYIKEMMKEGAGAAGKFAEIARNSYGWEVMRPEMLEDYYWQDVKETLIDDKHKLGTRQFFEKKNPYALQEMTGVMLETIRKGYWKADKTTIKQLSKLHAELVNKYQPGCSGFVCDNAKLRKMISEQLTPEQRKSYQQKITRVRTGAAPKKSDVKGMKLKKQEPQKKAAKELIKENAPALFTIGAIILLLFGAIAIGARRKKYS